MSIVIRIQRPTFTERHEAACMRFAAVAAWVVYPVVLLSVALAWWLL
jgi:hypothetical protein